MLLDKLDIVRIAEIPLFYQCMQTRLFSATFSGAMSLFVLAMHGVQLQPSVAKSDVFYVNRHRSSIRLMEWNGMTSILE
jgi:hypothetical protein